MSDIGSEKAKTLDDAKHCPKCDQIGREHIKQRALDGNGLVYTFICLNTICPWYDTGWVVQVQNNGELAKHEGQGTRGKQFGALSDAEKAYAERQIEAVKRAEAENDNQ